ncbi:transforming acidic coiled-coil-containing protein 3-like isoform X2 [Watersipora subatra]|uniref:transforming acidic coiled-coil-containing protein 3-like isoform X2 n=1 Tax=Watersipora subatra TaxID=2589382 RepID=UPI00355C4E0C
MSDDALESLLENLGALSLSSATDSQPKFNRTVLGEIQANCTPVHSSVKPIPLVVKALSTAEVNFTPAIEIKAVVSELKSEPETDQFDIIRELDEKERWTDRNIVITSLDHEENKKVAVGILDSIIERITASGEPETNEEAVDNGPSLAADSTQILDTLIEKLPAAQPVPDIINFDPLASASPIARVQTERSSDCSVEEYNRVEAGDLTFVSAVPDKEVPNLDETFDIATSANDCNQTFDIDKDETAELQANPILNVTVDLGPDVSPLNNTFTCESSTVVAGTESTLDSDITVQKEQSAEDTVLVADSLTSAADAPQSPPKSDQSIGCEQVTDSSNPSINSVGAEIQPICALNKTIEPSHSDPVTEGEVVGVIASDSQPLGSSDKEHQPIEKFDYTHQPISNTNSEAKEIGESQSAQASASSSLDALSDLVSDLAVSAPQTEKTSPCSSDKAEDSSNQSSCLNPVTKTDPSGVNTPSRLIDCSVPESGCQQAGDQPLDTCNSVESLVGELANTSETRTTSEGKVIDPAPLSIDEQPISTGSKMAEEEEVPIPRGAYTINWDEIDEFADPFAMSKPKGSKSLMAVSPPIRPNACPPSFDPPATSEKTSGDPSTTTDTPASADVVPDVEVKPSVTEKPEAPEAMSDDLPVKKKSPIKKKKASGKPSSRLAEFKKKQASKLKDTGGQGDGPDLTLSIPPAVNTVTDDDPIPPPAAYDLDNCDDPFGSKKSKMASSPPIRAKPVESLDYENVEDPFGTKTKMAVSPTAPAPLQLAAAETAPPTQFADNMVSEPAVTSPSTTTNSVNPFMSAAELASPDAVKVLKIKNCKDHRLDSPAKESSSATNGSQEDDFIDAVDELPTDMFKPAVPDMFNTTADLGVLDRAARMKPSFRESGLAKQSLYQKFDPLVEPALPDYKVEESLCLIGEFDATKIAEPETKDVDRLLDITIPADGGNVASLKYTQDEMDELQESLKQYTIRSEAQRLEYEAQILEMSKKNSQLEERIVKLEDVSAQYARTAESLIEEKESAAAMSNEALVEVRADRDKYAEDLAFVESSFTDLHKRYDSQREALDTYKRNEAILRKKLSEEKRSVNQFHSQFESLKKEYETKLKETKAENEHAIASMQGETACMEMAKRKAEIAVESLNQQLGKKTTEIAELTRICDSLIERLKGGS